MSHAQVRDGSMLKLRTRLVAIYAALAFATVVAWVAAFWTFHDHQVLLYTCLLAYAFGFRHAVDADHIATIDNVTRKLVADGRTGFLIVALFVVSWIVSAAVYRFKGYDRIEVEGA